MTVEDRAPTPRKRGSVRRMRDRVQVRVSAGEDPSTGERIILVDSVPIEVPGNARSEKAALKEAERRRTKLLADADALKVARTKATVGALLERWMAQHEIDATTRMTYESQIRNYIVPAIGDVPLVLFVREAAGRLEPFYARLRRCRALCSGKPRIERHSVEEAHDCVAKGCKRHVCKPYAASSVRSIHAILSGACSAAVRWGWIAFNPMPSVRPPFGCLVASARPELPRRPPLRRPRWRSTGRSGSRTGRPARPRSPPTGAFATSNRSRAAVSWTRRDAGSITVPADAALSSEAAAASSAASI